MGTGIFAVEQKNKVLCFNYLCAHRPLDCPQILRRRPLFYAWGRGANQWEAETQRRFANDSANLLPVGAMVNRSKGAAGPLEWLPPSEAFACEYLLRFDRVTDRYDLNLRSEEAAALEQLTAEKCD